MRENHAIGLIMAVAAIAGSCTTFSAPVPARTAETAAARGVDMESVQRGRALAVTECAECHRLHRPREYSPEEWPEILRRMGNRASLSEGQIADLTAYFQVVSEAERSATGP